MAATIKIKNSSTAGAAPTSSDLVQGELAVNVTDKRLFTENSGGTVVELGTNPSSITLPDGSASAPTLLHSGDTNTGLFFPAADTIALTTGGSERLRLDSSGNLGLGATPSAWATYKGLQVNNSSLAGVGNATVVSSNAYFDGTNWKYIASNYATLYQQSTNAGDGTHKWSIAASGTAGNSITFTQAMTLDASGNLGVGTTSPDQKLHVYGNSGTPTIAVGDNTITQPYVYLRADVTNSYGALLTRSNHALVFGTNNTERARIDTNGQADFYGTANVIGARSGAAAGTTNRFYFGTYGATNTQTGTISYTVWTNGNVVNTNNSYGALSDIKLKENIEDATPKLAELCQVRVVNYNFKEGQTQKQIGVIAQELEQVFPSMVEESPDVDAEGNDLGTTTKSVKYSVFVPMLIKAIQEQQAIITQLQADVAALKG